MADDRFCSECDVDLGLHGTNEPDEQDCRNAEAKADLMDRFWMGPTNG